MTRNGVRLLAIAGVAALLAAGCATPRFWGWIGLDISEAISRFGPPTQTLPVKDGTLYVWHERKDSQAPMPAAEFPDSRSGATRIPGPGGWLYRRWEFFADSRGKIGFWTVQESRSPSLFDSPVVCGP
jgi:hypothetical protein